MKENDGTWRLAKATINLKGLRAGNYAYVDTSDEFTRRLVALEYLELIADDGADDGFDENT